MENIGKLFYQSALELGLNPVLLQKEIDGFEIKLCNQVYFFRRGMTPFNTLTSASIGMNKFSTNRLLDRAGVPVPNAVGITYQEYKKDKWSVERLRFPVVCKPAWDSACGMNVICNIKDKEGVIEYFNKHMRRASCINVEEYHGGLRSFRVLVFYGEVIGLVERKPAHVVGDGKRSIRQLIRDENKTREKQKKTIPTGPFNLNEETWMIFEELGVTIDTIAEKDQVVPLRYVCNSTHGGTFKSLDLDQICDENVKLAIHAAKTLGLNYVGFDVICEDIGIPIGETRGYFVEANPEPDITIHENAIDGKQVKVSKIVLEKFIQKHKYEFYIQKFKNHRLAIMFFKTASVIALLGITFWGLQLYA